MAVADRFELAWTPFLTQRGRQTLQAVGLRFPTVLGSGGSVTLRVGDRKYSALTTELLRQPAGCDDPERLPEYLWPLPRPKGPVKCQAQWRTPGGKTYRADLLLKPAAAVRIHVVFKTHLDIGYTGPEREVIRQYRTVHLKRLLDNLDATDRRSPGRRFTWTLSAWLLEQCLDPAHVDATDVQRLERHVRRGNISWTLVPFTTHSEFSGREELCRSLYAARRLAERFRRPVPAAAKLTDVPAHTASLGMALAAAGCKFLQIGTNPNSRPPGVPGLFWWQLPDRGRLLVHHHGTYGTPLLPPEDWPYGEWLALLMTGDNLGPPGLDAIEQLDWIARHFEWPQCRTGSLEDFASAVIRRHGAALPVVDKEMTDWWIYGIGSQAGPTALARRDKDRLPAAETLLTLAAWQDGAHQPAQADPEIRQAFEQLSLYTEHTWGDHASDARAALPAGNLYTSGRFAAGTVAGPVDRWVRSWADKARHALAARAHTDRIEAVAAAQFSRAVLGRPVSGTARAAAESAAGGTPPARGTPPGAASCSIVLYNVLGWARSGVVRMKPDGLPTGEFELVDAATGGVVAYERSEEGIELIAPPVPACGYLCLEVRPVTHRSRPGQHADWEARALTVHTNEHTLQFHQKGGLARWHDRRHSVQWCSGTSEHPTGAYLYEMPGEARIREFARRVHSNVLEGTEGFFHRRDYRGMSQFGPYPVGPARVEPQITPLFSRVRVASEVPVRRPPRRRSGDARSCLLSYTLYRGRPELHVRLRLAGKAPTYAAEAGYACFPFAVEQPYVLVDRIAHLTTPADDLAAGVNAGHMAVHHGVRVEGDHAGMNFYPLDCPLLSFGSPGAYYYNESGRYADATIYATLFNNCWGTNFALWQSGDLSFDFVLQPTGNDGWDGGLARGGLECFRPLAAAVVPGRPACPARSLLKIEPAAVQLVTLKPADFQPGYCLRLWNSLLDPAEATVALPAARRGNRLWACDILERTRRPIPIQGNGIARLRMRPHEMATLLLT